MLTSARSAILCVCLVAGALVGCSGRSETDAAVASVNATNLQRLANLYFAYQSKHNWNGPADEAEFKTFLRAYNPAKLNRIGVDPNAIDELFVSERDSQPFKIRYGVAGSVMGSSAPVVFESTGEGGKRFVAFLNMEQREVDEAEYNTLWSAKAPATPERDSRPY